ncbi:MAG: hypothetical protein KF716_15235 [Anaerolineae bacterium]|nr:hypothetical protein [Anaerolineae bacterium]
MPVQVVWDDKAHTRLRQIYFGTITIDDYIQATDEIVRLAKPVSHAVHTIIDQTQALSASSVLLPILRYANKHMPPNLGVRVIVGTNMFTRALVDLGHRVVPRLVQHLYFADSIEDALAFIEVHGEEMRKVS